jgi:hypothetical protein
MNGQRNIRRRIRKQADGVDIAADINAAINVNTNAVNTGGSGRTTVSRSVQSTAITQTSNKDKEKR